MFSGQGATWLKLAFYFHVHQGPGNEGAHIYALSGEEEPHLWAAFEGNTYPSTGNVGRHINVMLT